MDNSTAWSNYVDYTRDLTEFSRKLAFAGIAICWVLKPENGSFSQTTLIAISLIVLFFVLDITQYSLGAIRWRNWIQAEENKKFEKTGSIEGDYSPPQDLDHPVFITFWLKVAVLSLGFLSIGAEVVQRFG